MASEVPAVGKTTTLNRLRQRVLITAVAVVTVASLRSAQFLDDRLFARRSQLVDTQGSGVTSVTATDATRGDSSSTQVQSPNPAEVSLATSDSLESSKLANLDSNASLATASDVPPTAPLPPCSRTEIIDGSWVPATLPRAPYHYRGEFKCVNDEAAYSQEWSTHKWIPTRAAAGQCTFADFDVDTMCGMLSNQTVLMVGDSITWESFASLSFLLSVRGITGKHQLRAWKRNIGFRACQNRAKLVHRRDNPLTTLRDAINKTFPTILVLNRGAHYVNDTMLMSQLSETVSHVQAWQRECQQRGLTCRFFWRTTVPGHFGCANFTAPVNDKAQMEAYIANRSNYDEPAWSRFHWQDFQHQNELVLDLWQRHNVPHQVLDSYHLNVLRPDHHVSAADCLHNCYPGKMDVHAQLLMHYLGEKYQPPEK